MSKFIRKAHAQQLGSVMSTERKLSVTLLIVSAASTLTLLPWVIIMCISISSDRYLWIKFTPMKIASTFYHLNSILNPVIYAIRLTEFRRASKELFCKSNVYPVRDDQPIIYIVSWTFINYVNLKCIHRQLRSLQRRQYLCLKIKIVFHRRKFA